MKDARWWHIESAGEILVFSVRVFCRWAPAQRPFIAISTRTAAANFSRPTMILRSVLPSIQPKRSPLKGIDLPLMARDS
jgi:hypothetical protein